MNVKMQRNRLRSAQRAYEQQAFSRLRELVPTLRSRHKKSSKLETLEHTCAYIGYLKGYLEKLQERKMERDNAQNGKEDDVKSSDEGGN